MKGQRDYLYAYKNLQESFSALLGRLSQEDAKYIEPLKDVLSRQTPGQMSEAIDRLTLIAGKLKGSNDLNIKVTEMLIQRFVMNATRFKNDLAKDLDDVDDVMKLHSGQTTNQLMQPSLDEFFSKVIRDDIEEVQKALTEYPPLLTKLNVDGWSIIHYCAAYGTPQMMEVLVESGADINACTDGMYTPSMLAARQNNLACLKKLCALNADMSLTNRSNREVVDFLADHNKQLEDMLSKVEDTTLQLDSNGDIEIILGHAVYLLECH